MIKALAFLAIFPNFAFAADALVCNADYIIDLRYAHKTISRTFTVDKGERLVDRFEVKKLKDLKEAKWEITVDRKYKNLYKEARSNIKNFEAQLRWNQIAKLKNPATRPFLGVEVLNDGDNGSVVAASFGFGERIRTNAQKTFVLSEASAAITQESVYFIDYKEGSTPVDYSVSMSCLPQI